MVQGESSIPRKATDQEPIIEKYEIMVATLEGPKFRSKYVKVLGI